MILRSVQVLPDVKRWMCSTTAALSSSVSMRLVKSRGWTIAVLACSVVALGCTKPAASSPKPSATNDDTVSMVAEALQFDAMLTNSMPWTNLVRQVSWLRSTRLRESMDGTVASIDLGGSTQRLKTPWDGLQLRTTSVRQYLDGHVVTMDIVNPFAVTIADAKLTVSWDWDEQQSPRHTSTQALPHLEPGGSTPFEVTVVPSTPAQLREANVSLSPGVLYVRVNQ